MTNKALSSVIEELSEKAVDERQSADCAPLKVLLNGLQRGECDATVDCGGASFLTSGLVAAALADTLGVLAVAPVSERAVHSIQESPAAVLAVLSHMAPVDEA